MPFPQSQVSRYVLSVVLGFTFIAGCGATLFLLALGSRHFETAVFRRIPSENRQAASERERITSNVRLFLLGREQLSPSLFTEREQAHMRDVKGLVVALRWFTVFNWVIFGVALLWFLPERVRVSAVIRSACLYAAWSLVVSALGMTLFFEQIFLRFHEVSFSNDLWLLDPAEHALIRVYPQEFFLRFTVFYLIVLMILFGAISRAVPKK